MNEMLKLPKKMKEYLRKLYGQREYHSISMEQVINISITLLMKPDQLKA